MKTPDEMYESVIRRRDALMAERRIRRKKIVRGGTVVLSMIILVIISALIYQGHKDKSSYMDGEAAVIESTDQSSAYMLTDGDLYGNPDEKDKDYFESDITKVESTVGEEKPVIYGCSTTDFENDIEFNE